jgi:hypothetical protein
MNSIAYYPTAKTAARFGNQHAQHAEGNHSSEPAPDYARVSENREHFIPPAYGNSSTDRLHFDQAQQKTAQPPAAQMLQSMILRIEKFLAQLAKAFKTLLGREPIEPKEPVLNESLKRFKKAVQRFTQDPGIAQNMIHNIPRTMEVQLTAAKVPDEEKNAYLAQLKKELTPEKAKVLFPHSVALALDELSSTLEDRATLITTQELFNQAPEFLEQALKHAANTAEEDHHSTQPFILSDKLAEALQGNHKEPTKPSNGKPEENEKKTKKK